MISAIIYILLITFGIGLPLVLVICPKINRVSAVGLSFPIGIGIFTFLMFLSNIVGIRFNLLNESLILILISLPLIILERKHLKQFFLGSIKAFRERKLSPLEKVMIGVLVFIIATSFINTFYWPVHIWDSIVLYDFRAHVFADTGFMKTAFVDNYYTNYPLLTSLAQSIIYLAGGKSTQFIHSLFYLSLGITFYGFLREFVSRKISTLFTLILLVAQPLFYHSLISYTNLAFSVYISLAAICIFLWDQKKDNGYLILSALLASLSTWTRSNEPFWAAILLIVFIVSIYRKKVWETAIFSLIFFPIREIWKVFHGSINVTTISTTNKVVDYPKILSSIFNLERWVQVGSYLYKNVVMPWGTVFAAFLIATIALFILKKQKKYFLIFFITFVFLAVLIAGTIQLSISTDYWYRIGDAAQRLSMLFYPLFVYCVALVIQEFVKIKK